MSHEARNTEILRKIYAQWRDSKGKTKDLWLGVVAEEVKFGSLAQGRPDSMAFTRERQTKAEVEQYLDELARDWEMIDYVIDEYVAQGDRVVAIGRMSWRNKHTKKVADSPKLDVWRFDDAGKAIEFYEYYDTAAAAAAAS